MNDKLTHCFIGSVVSWLLAIISYLFAHMTQLAGFAAVVASVFTAMAAFEKWRFFRRKRKDADIL